MARIPLVNLMLTGWLVAAACGIGPSAWVLGIAAGQDSFLFGDHGFDPYGGSPPPQEIVRLQLFPDSLIYHPYLAGPREPRIGLQFFTNDDDDWSWFSTVGGQLGLIRFGTYDAFRPKGVQLDVEAAAQFRSSDSNAFDFASTDVRFGFPLTVGWGGQETKLELVFLRSEASGDGQVSLPYPLGQVFEREALVLGHSVHLSDWWRVYGEVGYVLHSDEDGNWEFQLGTEWAPVDPTHLWGAPFAAANAYLFNSENYGGNLMLQAGWMWRGRDARSLRIGGFYSNGVTNSTVLENRYEQQLGFGIWRDF